MTNFDYSLDNLQKDCETILKNPTHNLDLLNIVLEEDVMELIKFARKVSKVLNNPVTTGCGEQFKGYLDTINTLREEIFD